MPLPDDWTVLISDVVNSTGAIERGEYKSVNMVGAASIVAVLNGCAGIDVPFMFGGDGGVVAVPPGALKAARTRLGALEDQCEALFSLTLRTAAIPVHALRRAGTDVQVRKFQLAGNNHLAMFAGGGLELADKWLKDETQNNWHLVPEDAGKSLDLEGLSCRWQPLNARNGVMLTIILQTAGDKVTASQILQKPDAHTWQANQRLCSGTKQQSETGRPQFAQPVYGTRCAARQVWSLWCVCMDNADLRVPEFGGALQPQVY